MSNLSKAGTLKHGRNGHGVIFNGEKFLVVGGSEKSEVCTLKSEKVDCVEQSTIMEGYAYYPELFLVVENFGKDKNEC